MPKRKSDKKHKSKKSKRGGVSVSTEKRKSSSNTNTNKINITIGGGGGGSHPVVVHHQPLPQQQQLPQQVVNKPQYLDESSYSERIQQAKINENLLKSIDDLRNARLDHFSTHQPRVSGLRESRIPQLRPTKQSSSVQTEPNVFHDPTPTTNFGITPLSETIAEPKINLKELDDLISNRREQMKELKESHMMQTEERDKRHYDEKLNSRRPAQPMHDPEQHLPETASLSFFNDASENTFMSGFHPERMAAGGGTEKPSRGRGRPKNTQETIEKQMKRQYDTFDHDI